MALTSLVGVTIERVAYRPLRKRGAQRLYLVITALMFGLLGGPAAYAASANVFGAVEFGVEPTLALAARALCCTPMIFCSSNTS